MSRMSCFTVNKFMNSVRGNNNNNHPTSPSNGGAAAAACSSGASSSSAGGSQPSSLLHAKPSPSPKRKQQQNLKIEIVQESQQQQYPDHHGYPHVPPEEYLYVHQVLQPQPQQPTHQVTMTAVGLITYMHADNIIIDFIHNLDLDVQQRCLVVVVVVQTGNCYSYIAIGSKTKLR